MLTGQLQARQVDLARTAMDNLEKLGPTYIKLGQIMSIRCVRQGPRYDTVPVGSMYSCLCMLVGLLACSLDQVSSLDL